MEEILANIYNKDNQIIGYEVLIDNKIYKKNLDNSLIFIKDYVPFTPTNVNISTKYSDRTVFLKTGIYFNDTNYMIGFASKNYSIMEDNLTIEIYYEKFLYDINDNFVDYIVDENDEKILYVRKGRLMPEFDVNGIPTGGMIDEYTQWIQILTNQKLIDPRPFIQQGILEEEGLNI